MASEGSRTENDFWHSLGSLRSANDAALDPEVRGDTDGTSAAQQHADGDIGGGAAPEICEAERVSSAGRSKAGAGATDGGASATAGGASASSTSASSHAAGRWQPPEVKTVDGGRQMGAGRLQFANKKPLGCQIRVPRPSAAETQLPNAVRFRISLALKRPGAHASASTAGSPAYTPLDQLRRPLPHPPLQLLRGGRRDDLVAPELDVPLDGEPVTCQLQISHDVTSHAYHEHRSAGGLVWEASMASGGASLPPTALFCLRVEPVDPSLAAEHPELGVVTNGFEIVSRLRPVGRPRPEGERADESAPLERRFRSLSISGSAPLRMPAGPPRLPTPRAAGAPRFRVLSGSAAGGRVGAVGGACGLVRPGSTPACRPCPVASP